MATPSTPVGYECEFVDQVPEDYFCKQCSHVAREPQIASCCTEVFCKACIEAVIEDKSPCPSCQKPEVSCFTHNKFHPRILCLKIHCSLKDRGCEWTGQLQHLDAHLDLTTGDCVYVDVGCPSKCNQKVQKHNVDTHLANHCPNRDYTCPYCSFKATFREVSEHFEVCRYYTLACPNRCGASFERDVLEDHIQMCGRQKLQCEFSYAGCGAEFIRDHQKDHMEQNTQKHLALVAAATLRISQAFEQKLQDKELEIKKMISEQRQQSETLIEDLEEKLEKKLVHSLDEKDEQLKTSLDQQQKVFEKTLDEQREEFRKSLEQKSQHINQLEEMLNTVRIKAGILPYYITLSNFSQEKERDRDVCSPPIYTHQGGYKLQILFQPNGRLSGKGRHTHLSVEVYSIKGRHDDQLEFPATITVAIQLLNQHRDRYDYTRYIQLVVTKRSLQAEHDPMTAPKTSRSSANTAGVGFDGTFISHSDLEWNEDKQTQYLKNNCLKIKIPSIAVRLEQYTP